MARYEALPPGLPPRGLTREAAAAYVGVCKATYDRERAKGTYPGPTLPGRKIDRYLLDEAANKLSGIMTDSEAHNPLDAWRKGRDAR
ncbi:hypothetical protein V5F77_10955 [Xanthobacter sp. DSM 24535]|uniref:hypothetical protein n=1 Tax=Roseixanthobacter psychrophilus TaxID=3119917 RepID=UPI003726AB9E